jgi:hypothetical protein
VEVVVEERVQTLHLLEVVALVEEERVLDPLIQPSMELLTLEEAVVAVEILLADQVAQELLL